MRGLAKRKSGGLTREQSGGRKLSMDLPGLTEHIVPGRTLGTKNKKEVRPSP